MVSAWPCRGSIAAVGRPISLRLRDAFLGTVAVGALSLVSGGPALAGPDACTPSGGGTIETCSGNQSAGIASGTDFTFPPVTTLNVNSLTTAIAPASGTNGIIFTSAGAVTINSNTGTFGINTSNAIGIYAGSSLAATVTSSGNITIAGSGATGIAARGLSSTVTSTGNVTTSGYAAYGIDAFAGGGAIKVTSTGNITTTGGNAHGIIATSYGTGAVTVTSTGNITTTGNDAVGILIATASNYASAATVTSTGNITTAGNTASGILAIARGPVTITSTGNIATTGAGAKGIYAGATGNGAVVTVTSIGNITTAGDNAAGIVVGFTRGGSKGAVTVTSIGNITTAGTRAYGILARANGPVTVTSTGDITTTGNNAYGIFAESQKPIAVTIKSGTVSGGTGTGAGVDLVGGTNNTLTNFGTLTALSGLAIKGDTGNNTVNNSGTVIGNVVLGTGTNAFNNMAGGLFDAGATVNLGAGNVLTNAGTLSPGGVGVIQTTALTGNLVQGATGRLLTDINIAGGTSDRINLSGTANLAGAVQLQVSNLTFAPWQQTIVSAVGGTTNNGLALLASPALQAQLVYPNATDVVVKSTGLNFVVPGLNNNQTSLANALNTAGHTDGLGGPVFNLLLNGVTSVAGYNAVLNQLTGEAATGTQQTTFDAMNLFMGTMTDPSNRGTTSAPGGAANGYASEGDAYASTKNAGAARDAYAMLIKAPPVVPFEQRWSVWAAGFGGSQTTDGNAIVGSNNTTSSVYGTAVGADYIFSPYTIAGFALAGGGTNFSVANSGSGHSDLFQAGAFIRHTVGPAYISAALAYGWQDITTNRTLTVAGTDQLRAQFDANAFSGRLEGGYRFVAPWVGGIGITPYAAAQFTTFDLPGYAEQAVVGTNNFALAYGAKDVTDTRSELGLRADKSFAMRDGILTLRGRVAWAHDFDPNRSIASTFQSLPGASFVVNGAAQAADSALVTASVEKKWLSGWSAAATFEGEFSDVTRSYAGKGVVRYAW
jgi:uncharacterized protein with beta-barrel porin domain